MSQYALHVHYDTAPNEFGIHIGHFFVTLEHADGSSETTGFHPVQQGPLASGFEQLLVQALFPSVAIGAALLGIEFGNIETGDGEVREESARVNNPTVITTTLVLTEAQYNAASDYVEDVSTNTNSDYDVFGLHAFHCGDFAQGVLNAAGLTHDLADLFSQSELEQTWAGEHALLTQDGFSPSSPIGSIGTEDHSFVETSGDDFFMSKDGGNLQISSGSAGVSEASNGQLSAHYIQNDVIYGVTFATDGAVILHNGSGTAQNISSIHALSQSQLQTINTILSQVNSVFNVSAVHSFFSTPPALIGQTNLDQSNTINGSTSADVLFGDDGSDVIDGANGDDLLLGGDGDDSLAGGRGDDVVDGGLGVDTADYSQDGGAAGISVDLTQASGQVTDTHGDTDTLVSIEHIIGSSSSDIFIGDSTANRFIGADGADQFVASGGNDTLTGGSGIDVVDYSGWASGINVAGANVSKGSGYNDTLSGIEHIIGTSQSDGFIGDGSGNVFEGRGGDDTFVGGAGSDSLDGGSGSDTVDYSQDGGSYGVTVNLDDGAARDTFGNTDALSSIEQVIGTNQTDNILGGADAETLRGNGGADLLFGGGGNDALFGDAGNDVLIAGSGSDLLQGGADADQLYGGKSGRDYLYGGAGNDKIYAGSQGSVLFGNDDNVTDVLYGGKGRDTFVLGHGDYAYDVGERDRVVFLGEVIRASEAEEDLSTWTTSNGTTVTVRSDGTIRLERGSAWAEVSGDPADSNGPHAPNSPPGLPADSPPGPPLDPNDPSNFPGDPGGEDTPDAPEGGDPSNPGGIPEGGSEDEPDNGSGGNAGAAASENQGSPIVLDLDGDGIELTSLARSTTRFDVNNDGFSTRTGWIAPDDGLLVIDLNGNGSIDSGAELFGDATGFSDGYAALAVYDTNTDGKIDAADAQYADLRVWRDLNLDGRSTQWELFTLDELGIQSISVNATAVTYQIADQDVIFESTFTWDDGTTGTSVDVLFSFDNFDAIAWDPVGGQTFDQATIDRVNALPNIRGFGQVVDLHSAMLLNPVLLQMVEDFMALGEGQSLSTYTDAISDILIHWAGQEGVDPTTRGSHIDARILEAYEEFLGRDWSAVIENNAPDPGQLQAERLMETWTGMVNHLMSRLVLLGMTPASNPTLEFDYETNALVLGDSTQTLVSIITNAPENVADFPLYWASRLSILDSLQEDGVSIGTSLFQPALDVLVSREPTDQAQRSAFWTGAIPYLADLFSFSLGDQQNFAVSFYTYLAQTELQDIADLFVSTASADFLGTDANNELLGSSESEALFGGAGDDNLIANEGDDLLAGGTGDDHLQGHAGDDIYIWGSGLGNDVVEDNGSGGVGDTADIIELLDIDFEDVAFHRSGTDLIMTITATGEFLTIKSHYQTAIYEVETIRFADGTTLATQDISLVVEGTSGADTLNGSNSSEVIRGFEGNDVLTALDGNDLVEGGTGDDTLYGGDGNDRLDGGAGTDLLQGSAGDDTYVWGAGLGNDTVNESGAGGADVIEFTNLNASDVTYSRVGTDLLITASSTGETLTIRSHYSGAIWEVETIRFADGSTLNTSDITFTFVGTEGSDTLTGSDDAELMLGLDGNDTLNSQDGDDRLDGGLGDDILHGNRGNDTYVWGSGLGNDTAHEASFGTGADVVELTNLNEADVMFSRSNNDFVVIATATGETFTIKDYYLGAAYEVETIQFADGTTLATAGIPIAYIGTSGPDTVTGSDDAELLQGLAGNDTLNSQRGDDRLEGGEGNDTLRGYQGSDTYVWGSGLGNDIAEEAYFGTGIDVIELTNLNEEDVTFGRLNSDLVITATATGETFTIKDHYNGTAYEVETIQFANGTTLATSDVLLTITGTAAGETLTGSDSAELLQGLGGSDTLHSQDGDDRLEGGAGDDTLNGHRGSDTYVWGSGLGNDIANEAYYGTGLDIIELTNLNSNDVSFSRLGDDLIVTATATGETFTVNDQYSGTAYEVETIQFADGSTLATSDITFEVVGTAGADTLTGSDSADLMQGLGGNDTLHSQDGDDRLEGGAGDDTLNGHRGSDTYVWGIGLGNDIANEAYYGNGIDVIELTNLNSNDVSFSRSGDDLIITATATGETFTVNDQYRGAAYEVETIQFGDGTTLATSDIAFEVVGTAGADNLSGSDSAETIQGLGGNDTLDGLNGDDLLEGGAGDDTLHGRGGDDRLDGGLGDDTLRGNSGNDTYVWGSGQGNDSATEVSGGGTDVLELSNLNAGDVSFSRSGDDLVMTVTATGETLTMSSYYSSVHYEIETIQFADGSTLATADVLLTVVGTSGADNLTGSSSDELIQGLDGDDTLSGQSGDDRLDGGLGDDTLRGNSGNDTYVWGSGQGNDSATEVSGGGTDILELSNLNAGDVSFSRSGDDLVMTVTGTGETLTMSSYYSSVHYEIETIQFADGSTLATADVLLTVVGTSGADNLTGSSSDELIQGLDGDDTLSGQSGDDRLDGGLGDDTLRGNSGNDTYVWGSGQGNDSATEVSGGGTDILELSNLNAGDVSFSRSGDDLVMTVTGTGETFTITGHYSSVHNEIETIQFADGSTLATSDILLTLTGTSGAETLVGSASAELIQGLGGNDTLRGQGGNDRLDGGLGDDTLRGFTGDDTYVWGSGQGNDKAEEQGGGGTDILELSNLNAGDVSFSRSGDDLVMTVTGTGETFTITGHYSSVHNEIETIQFADGSTLATSDILLTLTGTSGAETLVGSASAELIQGLGGNDTLRGQGGNDRLDGGLGDDTLRGFTGDDTYVWGSGQGNDKAEEQGGGGTDILELSNLNAGDVSFSRSGDDLVMTVTGTGETFTITGHYSSVHNEIETIQFADGSTLATSDILLTLTGTSGAETLVGSASAELIQGLGGNDTLRGQGGNDRLDGGLGDDTLRGFTGDDTYVWGSGQGNDKAEEQGGGGTDILELSNLNAGDVSFSRSGDDLVMTVTGTGETFTITGHYSSVHNEIETIQFADGTTLATSLIEVGDSSANTLTADAAGGYLYGNDGADTLISGAGSDQMIGGAGADTYQYGRGGNTDTVLNSGASGQGDKILFEAGIAEDQLWFAQDGDDLLVTIVGTNDSVRIDDWYVGTSNRVDSFEVDDGSVLLAADVQALVTAMAAFSPPAVGTLDIPAPDDATLDPVIAANWS